MAEETNDEENVELHLHSTGELLRRAREQKNLSLEDIAKKPGFRNAIWKR
ncbi:RodZ family helix-turn-helix domain-containing protein [Sphingopyxis sp. BSNA05]|nr:hypothetical protein [Sphingopyxis sp. BSNA05]